MEPAPLDALMAIALEEARRAVGHADVPIGAVVARSDTGAVLSRRHNERELTHDPTAHAEVLALRDAAGELGSWRLEGCTLVVTLEPCPMCAGAAWAARLDGVVFGAADPKAGATGSLYHLGADPRLNHEFTVVDGVRGDECAALLTDFFAARRGSSDAPSDGVDDLLAHEPRGRHGPHLTLAAQLEHRRYRVGVAEQLVVARSRPGDRWRRPPTTTPRARCRGDRRSTPTGRSRGRRPPCTRTPRRPIASGGRPGSPRREG